MTAFVYLLKSDLANMVYVGSTRNIKRRMDRHMSNLRCGNHHNLNLQTVWDCYRDVELVSTVEFERDEDAEQFELEMIQEALELGRCCNINQGAEGGDTLTLNPRRTEVIEKISEGMRRSVRNLTPDEFNARYRKFGKDNPMFGRRHTAEARKKMSEVNIGRSPSNKGVPMSEEQKNLLSKVCPRKYGSDNHFFGRHHSDETKAKLREINLGKDNGQGHEIEVDGVVYRSYGDAAKKTGIPLVTIRHRCLSKNPKFSNYKLLSKCPTTIEPGARKW